MKNNLTRSVDGAQVYASRVKGRQILLDQPVRENKFKKEREEKKARQAASKKRSDAGVIPNAAARRKGLHNVAPSERRYAQLFISRILELMGTFARSASVRFDLFVDLHNLWMGYMTELLNLPPASSGSTQHAQTQAAAMHAKLIKADFHGAMITGRAPDSLHARPPTH